MKSLPTRPAFAVLLASLWVGWAVWANVPHYFNAQAMEKQIAAVVGQNNVNLEPATAGFPFGFMRYDYSNHNQLTVYDTKLSALLPNIMFSLVGALGIALLALRIRHISLGGIVVLSCLLAPAVLLYLVLNGLHPDVISYLYLAPVTLLLISFGAEMVWTQNGQNHRLHPSTGG